MGLFANSNDWIRGLLPMRTPSGPEVLSQRFTLALGTADLDLNDLGQVGWLPPGCVPVDVHVDGTDMDSSTAALIFTIGLMNAAGDDISTAAEDGGGAWGATVAANTAFHQRLTMTLKNMLSVTKSDSARKLVAKVTAAPTTAVAGTLGVTLFYRAA